jgi:ribosome silencing factor RsfS/YbeB/iojap
LATTKTPKSSTATDSKTRTRAAAPAAGKAPAKKAAVTKKPAPAKKAAAAAPAAKKSASKPGKAVMANRAAAAAKRTAKPAAKAPAKTASRKPSATATPVATPPQHKPRKPGKKESMPTDIVERLRLEVRRALEELKAKDVVELDVRGRTSIADFIVVAAGTSTRHVKSIADEVVKYAKKAGMMPLGVEGQREAEWVLVDLGDIIVHVMLPRVREFYGLERLWSVGGDTDEAAFA